MNSLKLLDSNGLIENDVFAEDELPGLSLQRTVGLKFRQMPGADKALLLLGGFFFNSQGAVLRTS